MPSENNNEIPLADQFSVLGVEEPNDGTKMITTTEATYFERNRNQLIRKTVPIAEERETTSTEPSSPCLCHKNPVGNIASLGLESRTNELNETTRQALTATEDRILSADSILVVRSAGLSQPLQWSQPVPSL
ncbi:hypothetical protein NPIL_10031 [Nephila pilipes]|uniref:Uncharacterized protein n=1 Tax=Nephila pilipes TaxID=299642 RepID=A0A8X6QLU8_NEPPI|nr:hypothetical protein NPIL_10031 [Nephila pilipes]